VFEQKTLDAPDNASEFPNGHAKVVNAGGMQVLQVTFEPGFRWTKDMPAVAGTATCQATHLLYVLSGRLGFRLSDGSEREVGCGDVVHVDPDHDSWTIGGEPVRFLDYQAGR
jgi:hypothetical protein